MPITTTIVTFVLVFLTNLASVVFFSIVDSSTFFVFLVRSFRWPLIWIWIVYGSNFWIFSPLFYPSIGIFEYTICSISFTVSSNVGVLKSSKILERTFSSRIPVVISTVRRSSPSIPRAAAKSNNLLPSNASLQRFYHVLAVWWTGCI